MLFAAVHEFVFGTKAKCCDVGYTSVIERKAEVKPARPGRPGECRDLYQKYSSASLAGAPAFAKFILVAGSWLKAGRHRLPHYARDEPGLAPRRLYFLLQETMRVLAGIARARIGPGRHLLSAVQAALQSSLASPLLSSKLRNRRRTGRSRFRLRCCAAPPRRCCARRRRSNYPGCAPARCSSASTPRRRHYRSGS